MIHANKSFRLFATRSELDAATVAMQQSEASKDGANNKNSDQKYRTVAVASASFGGNAQISKFLDSYWVTVRIVQQSAEELAAFFPFAIMCHKLLQQKWCAHLRTFNTVHNRYVEYEEFQL